MEMTAWKILPGLQAVTHSVSDIREWYPLCFHCTKARMPRQYDPEMKGKTDENPFRL